MGLIKIDEHRANEPFVESVVLGRSINGKPFDWDDMLAIAQWCGGVASRDERLPDKRQYWAIRLEGMAAPMTALSSERARMGWRIVHFKESGLFTCMAESSFASVYVTNEAPSVEGTVGTVVQHPAVEGIVGMVVQHPASEYVISELEAQIIPARTTIEIDLDESEDALKWTQAFPPGSTARVTLVEGPPSARRR